MKYVLDLTLAALIVVTVCVFCKRGFIRSIFGVAKTVGALILTYLFGPVASAWVNEHFVLDKVADFIYEKLGSLTDAGMEMINLPDLIEGLPDWLKKLCESINVDLSEVAQNFGTTEANAENMRDMSEGLASPLSGMLSDLLGYAAVFILSMLVLSLVGLILKKISELPVIRSCDKLLGFLLGVLCAALFASAYTALMVPLLGILSPAFGDIDVIQAVDETILFKWVTSWNLFHLLFGL